MTETTGTEEPVRKYDDIIWAKSNPYKPLVDHCIETGLFAKILLTESAYGLESIPIRNFIAQRISDEELINTVCYVSADHDIGKSIDLFIRKMDSEEIRDFFKKHPDMVIDTNISGYRHELGSAEICEYIWEEEEIFSDEDVRDIFIRVIRSHHPSKNGRGELWARNAKAANRWLIIQKDIERYIRRLFPPADITFDDIKPRCAYAFGHYLAGFLKFCDHLASSSYMNNCGKSIEEKEAAVRKTLKDLGLAGKHEFPCYGRIGEAFPFIKEARGLQKEIERITESEKEIPMFCLIEAGMGEGKTEAALFLAGKMARRYKKTGIAFLQPTMATSNQMVRRVSSYLNNNGLRDARLMHNMAWMMQEPLLSPQAEKWMTGSKRMLDASCVGTVDQAMKAAMNVMYNDLCLVAVSNKVLIIDEVHAYDIYMQEIISSLVMWCRQLGIPMIMMSATLSSKQKMMIAEALGRGVKFEDKRYPLITTVTKDEKTGKLTVKETGVGESFIKRTLRIKTIPYLEDTEKCAEAVIEEYKKGGCVCFIANTVSFADRLYRKVSEMTGSVILYHSHYTVLRRAQIERACDKMFGKNGDRPESYIVIATQVIEVGVDNDFDMIISEIAPIDILLQRAGREFRHMDIVRPPSRTSPEFIVVVPNGGSFGASGYVYYEEILQRTKDVVGEGIDVNIPEDIRVLVDKVYAAAQPCSASEAFMRYRQDEALKKTAGEIAAIGDPAKIKFNTDMSRLLVKDEDEFGRYATRIGNDSVRCAVIPEWLFKKYTEETGFRGAPGKETAIEISGYIFPITGPMFRKLFSEEDEISIKNGTYEDVRIGQGSVGGVVLMNGGPQSGGPCDDTKYNSRRAELVVSSEYGAYIS